MITDSKTNPIFSLLKGTERKGSYLNPTIAGADREQVHGGTKRRQEVSDIGRPHVSLSFFSPPARSSDQESSEVVRSLLKKRDGVGEEEEEERRHEN
ncbi:hypothetical protein TIFTF001_032498 [Ficus carica]|uniref:Uncharacterized protein n=1 Tax=Ficus carica TaxID=3494 RepID=A0AA88E0F8_FICCA|nr:hypothetical protein TIFTF001_032498 [Ficus carica]